MLFYRQLGFALHDITQLLDRPEFDRGEALRTQRDLQVQLGEGYVQDPRFTATYEAIEPGLTVFVRDAIRANARRATS